MTNPLRACFAVSVVFAAMLVSCEKPKPAPAPQSAVSPVPSDRAAADKPNPTNPDPSVSASGKTRIEMRNVLLHDDAAGTLRVQQLNGRVSPSEAGGLISLDDKKSFLIDIDSGVISTSVADMSKLLNDRIFGYPGSPLSDIVLTVKGTQLKLNAKVKKGVVMPIELLGEMGVTPDGKLRVHSTSLKALKIPVKGLLGAFGVKMSDLVDARGAKGVSVEGNDMILDVEQMLPPPRKRGKLTDVRTSGDQLVETFGHPVLQQKPPRWRSYLRFEGGVIEFGKLTMHDADLVLADSGNADWFDFDLSRYQKQLEAGYSKVTPRLGLESYMPGSARVKAGATSKPK
jgi:hypothetical protein